MESKQITSLQNDKIKRVVKLRERKYREEFQLTIVEGDREFLRAVEGGISVEEVFICANSIDQEINDVLRKLSCPHYEVTQDVFEKISYGDKKNGVVAVCSLPSCDLKNISLKKGEIVLVLDSVEKPGNLGAILRSADAVGCQNIILTNPQTDIFNPNVIRASLGAVFHLKAAQGSVDDVCLLLKDNGYKIYAADPSSENSCYDCQFDSKTAIVLGSEDRGLHEDWLNKSDQKVNIPMQGKIDSLNVSVSAAVLLYEIYRQRNK